MTSDDFGLVTRNPSICVGAIFETTLGDDNNAQIPQCKHALFVPHSPPTAVILIHLSLTGYIGASFLVGHLTPLHFSPDTLHVTDLDLHDRFREDRRMSIQFSDTIHRR